MNAFYHVGREGEEGEGKLGSGGVSGGAEDDDDEEGPRRSQDEETRRKMEREFRIGATGAADSCGKFPFVP